ncbi:MAG: cytochrome c assembly protein [Gemmatales bacterium]|nr:MAG: cytochrome c assembly protein [Gemmatales bacterium]
MPIERVTTLCFAASYAVAMIFELVHQYRPRPIMRLFSTIAGGAGLFAHSVFLLVQRPGLSTQFGSLLLLAWIVAVFYWFGSLHRSRSSWSLFALPLVLGLVLLAVVWTPMGTATTIPVVQNWEQFWGILHGSLLLLAGVGICVGFMASVMYLVQAQRLKVKTPPGKGIPLLSLERLEVMNRRALNLAFPLLTAGVLVGAILMLQEGVLERGWLDAKVIGSLVLWGVFVLLLYLRYGAHLPGKRLAILTIVAFALLLITLVSPSTHFAP